MRAWSRGYQRVEKRPREAGGERKGLQDEAHTSGQLEGWNQESHRISAREGGDGRAAKGVLRTRDMAVGVGAEEAAVTDSERERGS